MKILWLACAIAMPAVAQNYPVAGVVTDVVHGKPLERARVTLLGPRSFRADLTAGADGRFLFDVPEGRYSLYAEHNGWRLVYGNPEPSTGFGSAIFTGPDKDAAHLAFRWYAPGAVFGTVVDEQDEPLRDIGVQLIRDAITGGRRRILSTATTKTDDRGAYRFGPVTAGNYYVVAIGRPWHDSPFAGTTSADNAVPVPAYPPTYFPGVTDTSDAAILNVQPGSAIRGDIALRATVGATVKFRCPGSGIPDETCQGTPTLALQGIGGVELATQQQTDFRRHIYAGVAPGRYTVRAVGPGKTAYKVIDVGPGEFTFDLPLLPPVAIAGTVTFQNPLRAGAHEYVGLDNEITGTGTGNLIADDGSFSSRLGGRLRVRLYGTVPLFIAQMSLNGTPVKDGVIDVTEITQVQLKIVASDEMGRLKGFAMSAGNAAPAVLVVLAPAAGSPNPADYHGFQTENDGSFDYVAVPAGDYLLFSVDNLDLEYTNPDAIKPYLQSATPVHIAAHTVAEQRIDVLAKR